MYVDDFEMDDGMPQDQGHAADDFEMEVGACDQHRRWENEMEPFDA